MEYFSKMKGLTTSPPRVSWMEMLWSWVGSFAGISVVSYIHYTLFSGTDLMMIIGSFGASANNKYKEI
jgi:CBS-domain-containing membrane protein